MSSKYCRCPHQPPLQVVHPDVLQVQQLFQPPHLRLQDLQQHAGVTRRQGQSQGEVFVVRQPPLSSFPEKRQIFVLLWVFYYLYFIFLTSTWLTFGPFESQSVHLCNSHHLAQTPASVRGFNLRGIGCFALFGIIT